MPRPDREARLLAALDERPFLFVLDGLERILIAYNRMDASSLADHDYDQQTANRVAGAIGLPASAGQSFVGQHRLRQTTDPRAGAFLQSWRGWKNHAFSSAAGSIRANCSCRPALRGRDASPHSCKD